MVETGWIRATGNVTGTQRDRIVALIPARGGSKRCPGKNTRLLKGHPLLAWAIATAREAGIFSQIAVSSDDTPTLEIAERYGALPIYCPLSVAHRDYTPDILWVRHAMATLAEAHHHFDVFAILRPTSPFRRGAWVAAAWEQLCNYTQADSLRAMRPAGEHPGKMWRRLGVLATPLLPFSGQEAPWHSTPSQELPRIWVQTAALEIAWTFVLPESIAGDVVLCWECEAGAPEAIDINTEDDWASAEDVAAGHPEWLPLTLLEAPA